MIKQSFLNSLEGLPMDVAKEMCHKVGYQTDEVPDGCAVALIARPNTVILFHKNDKVVSTMAGDGLELDEDE